MRHSKISDGIPKMPEFATPPAVTIEMADGFTLHMVKAMISSGVDEVVDLARSNLWR